MHCRLSSRYWKPFFCGFLVVAILTFGPRKAHGQSCLFGSCPSGICSQTDECSNYTCNPPNSSGVRCCALGFKPNGTPCHVDSNVCFPNDTCQGGKCTRGPEKTCPTKECNSTSCDPIAGCLLTPQAGACGGVCSIAMCVNGSCPNMPKVCPASDQCHVGSCDPGNGNCLNQPAANGTACSLTDKCMVMATCQNGTCVGVPKQCPAPATCHVVTCNSTTGNCDDALAAAGTSCDPQNDCVETSACSATGKCVGNPLPDGTPCSSGCAAGGLCTGGTCNCAGDGGATDGGVVDLALAAPDLSGAIADGSTSTGNSRSGCDFSGSGTPEPPLIILLSLASLLMLRRRSGSAS